MDPYDDPIPAPPEGFDVDISSDTPFAPSYGHDSRRLLTSAAYDRSDEPPTRRTRWTRESGKVIIPGAPIVLPATMDEEQKRAWMIRVRLEEIARKLSSNLLDIDNGPDRSPSPEPTYDSQGKRTNTREQRAKTKLNKERQYLVEIAQTISPVFKPPSDYRPETSKKQLKVYIPDYQDHPAHKFIGLIIGPRGNTQKKMERESGAKIAIRGRGSVKEGKSRKDGKLNPGEDEKLHVLLIADNDDQIRKAEKMIRSLLVPIEEGKNEHKRQQLRELASINGTLRDDDICRNCGATGHRFWNCPDRGGTNWKPADVRCAICGETSHITRDCTNKDTKVNPLIDAEYESFMAELGEPKGLASGAPGVSGVSSGGSLGSYIHSGSARGPPPLPIAAPPPLPPPMAGSGFSQGPPPPPLPLGSAPRPGGPPPPPVVPSMPPRSGPPPPPMPSYQAPNPYGPPPTMGSPYGPAPPTMGSPYGPPPTYGAYPPAPAYGAYPPPPAAHANPPLPPGPPPQSAAKDVDMDDEYAKFMASMN
eukprot:TRINITY_DN11638_c0_g1_i1.p1 TRINITY_DN11638_c0_g1~~TRINITY_DN11638_c0_g1_i1.p1  ORF type:complete len:532 (-),score=107.96 TRINITY_DN11638_c0_g1_i1:148-1743(-)